MTLFLLRVTINKHSLLSFSCLDRQSCDKWKIRTWLCRAWPQFALVSWTLAKSNRGSLRLQNRSRGEPKLNNEGPRMWLRKKTFDLSRLKGWIWSGRSSVNERDDDRILQFVLFQKNHLTSLVWRAEYKAAGRQWSLLVLLGSLCIPLVGCVSPDSRRFEWFYCDGFCCPSATTSGVNRLFSLLFY